jgi:hypothetical protein
MKRVGIEMENIAVCIDNKDEDLVEQIAEALQNKLEYEYQNPCKCNPFIGYIKRWEEDG